MAPELSVLHAAADPTTDPAVELRSDAHLVRELAEGSHEALAVLYDRHVNTVFAAAMRAGRDSWIAAEVVQETFLALWNRAELFDASRGTLAGWLSSVARNRTIDHLRNANRHHRAATFSAFTSVEADGDAVVERLAGAGELIGAGRPEPSPEIALSSKETRASIAGALATLAPAERRVIELAYTDGLSQSEIATELGWPLGTVKTRTRRALRHLREHLEEPPPAGPEEADEIPRPVHARTARFAPAARRSVDDGLNRTAAVVMARTFAPPCPSPCA